MYAEHDHYMKYLLGRSPVVPLKEFPYWENQADKEIDKRTYGQLFGHAELVTNEVKDCACELAELLYQAHSVSQQHEGAGPLASYSNDGESGTFDLSRSIYTEEGKARKIREIIYKYLANTGLLYAGRR